jgi:protein-tyrosine sulfotransferase
MNTKSLKRFQTAFEIRVDCFLIFVCFFHRLMAGGMSEEILNSAVRAFIYEILIHHSRSADVLCDKDPFVLKYTSYISTIFPNSKFLLMIRDARAVIHSVMTRKVTITGFSLTDYRQNLILWNRGIETMYDQCKQVGSNTCLMVYYEQLVLQPKKTIANILNFLNLTWVESVLHHEELIGKKISLSK